MEVLRNIRTNVAIADTTYTEQECNLALSLESSFLYYVTCVSVALDTLSALDTSAAVQWQITRKSKTAIVGYNDSDVLFKGGWENLITTSGVASFLLTEHQPQAHPYAVASPSLYFGVLGTGIAASMNVNLNMSYYPQKVTQKQFWEASQTR